MSDLTKKPIPGLIRKLAIPVSIGFFFQTMYNVVDTFWAGRISTEALAALSISFPVFFLVIAFGSGLSTGSTALISNYLGSKKKKKVREIFHQSISLAIILSFILMIIGLILSPWLFKILGAQDSYLKLSLDYINIIFYGSIFFLLSNVLNAKLNARGETKIFRNVLIAGFFLNLILDPWFMYGGLGLPAMGVSGIALATVIIQFLSSLYLAIVLIKKKILDKNSFKELKPKIKTYIEIAKQGIPASLNMMTVAIGIFVITFFISKFGEVSVAAYGIATRIEQIALLPTVGLNIAALTIIGQNNGAKKFSRIKETLSKTIKYGIYMMIAGNILVFFLAEKLMSIFTEDPEAIAIGAPYLKIAAFIFYAYVILFTTTSALQGMKKPMYALYIGLARQIIGPIIVFSLLAFTLGMGIMGVWWGVFIITWTAAIITYFFAKYIIKKEERKTKK